MKIALCLNGLASHPGKKIVGGQMWNGKTGKRTPVDWVKSLEHYKEHILSKNNVDVFIHSPSLHVQDDLIEAYQPKASVFEEDPIFSQPGDQRKDPGYPDGVTTKTQITIARWYSIKKCVELKQQYEEKHGFKYDIVMIGRFDVAWMVDVDFSQFDPNYFYVSNWCVMRLPNGFGIRHEDWFFQGWDKKKDAQLKHTHIGWPHDPRYPALADYWFFGGSELIDRFSTLYDNIGKFLRNSIPSNHEFALRHLRELGLLNKIKFAFHIHDDVFLIRHVYTDWRH